MPLKNTYIQYGVRSDWASLYESIGIPASTFKQTSKKNLVKKYAIPEEQVDLVKDCLTRKPIDETILQELLEKNRFICCLCKGQKSDGYIIHHIIEYSVTQDNSYNNLAVLCPNDHDLAHRTGIALTNKITATQIIKAKKNWEKQVKDENKIASKKTNHSIQRNWKKTNIYKELQSYSENDQELFFGRDNEISELLKTLYKYHVVGLFGESGTGKTSLINAGLIPQLKSDAFTIISIRCLDSPIAKLRETILNALRARKISPDLIDKLIVTDRFTSFIVQLKAILTSEEKPLIIIIIDQFEELFTRATEDIREELAKGIIESLIESTVKSKMYFLFSLREDYIGEIWEWTHRYSLEDAWIRQYRIKRLDEEKAFEVITRPLESLGIKVNHDFIYQLVRELKKIGDGRIYPPYLQIVCSELFEEYIRQNSDRKPLIEFNINLLNKGSNVESIIADYLSDSMLNTLTSEEKIHAENILDLLTGPEGLRSFLNIDEISRYLSIEKNQSLHVIEHLIKKKIVHPLVENDIVTGYELVHDFLSKKFFEKLSPEAKKAKTAVELFRKAYKDWKQHGVLASQGTLEILFKNIHQLKLDDDEWMFLLKSSFSVYWYSENEWPELVNRGKIKSICLDLLHDNDERIVESSIRILGSLFKNEVSLELKDIIESPEKSVSIKVTAIFQFMFNIYDEQIIETLKNIIKTSKEHKLRKAALSAFGYTIQHFGKTDSNILEAEIDVIYLGLNDSKTEVRRQAASLLSYSLVHKKSVVPLLERLRVENSISSRKEIVISLGALLRKEESVNLIFPVLKKVAVDSKEDYRVKEEANQAIMRYNQKSVV